MPWVKGQSGNPSGQKKDAKPYRDALLLELAAGDDDIPVPKRSLRFIARQMLNQAAAGDLSAIQQVADRLDGKPAQESTVTFDDKRDATDWTRAELVAFLNDARAGGNGAAKANGSGGGPDSVH